MPKILATPRHLAKGVKDDSTRAVPVVADPIPQWLPLVFTYTDKGDYKKRKVNKAEFDLHYGASSLNLTNPAYNHVSELMSSTFEAGGQVNIQRLHNVDASSVAVPVAKTTLYMVLSDEVDALEWDRGLDGKVKRNATTGVKEVTANVSKRRYAYFVTETQEAAPATSTIAGAFEGALEGIVAGTVIAGTRYPIATFTALGHGAEYNNYGVTLDALLGTQNDDAIYVDGQLQYRSKVVYNKTGTAKTVLTEIGETYIEGVLKTLATDPVTNGNIDLLDLFNGYERIFESITFDYTNLKLIQTAILTTMKLTTLDAALPWVTGTDDEGKVNIINAKDVTEVEYEGFVVQPLTTEITAVLGTSEYTSLQTGAPVYLKGGADGDVTDVAKFETLVVTAIEDYGVPASETQIIARNYESVFIDSGFTATTKLKLPVFISKRKDVMFIGSTYENTDLLNTKETLASAKSTGALLTTALRLYQESEEYGTPAMRAVVVMGSGVRSTGNYRYRLPLTHDLVYKAAKYMGSRRWKGTYEFNSQLNGGSLVERLKDIDLNAITDSAKDDLWKTGLVWVDSEDLESSFYPGIQSVYVDDTSVANSLPVQVAICTLEKELDAVWRHHSGTDLSNVELKLSVEGELADSIADIFNSKFTIIPEVTYSFIEELQGFSWSCRFDFYAGNMKTRMASHITLLRASEL